ncbi:M14 family metallopeptidase [candidate division KSB1 bacterium]
MKSKIYIKVFILFCVLCRPASGISQDEPDLFPGGTYNSEIPTPYEIIGHRFGELHTFTWEMENFIHALAGESDRIIVRNYGRTYQGRNLYTMIISSPENLNRLEEIKRANMRLTDPRATSRDEAEEIAGWMPSIVWLGYNIHGNEVSGMEAAIRTVYQLAAGTDETTGSILRNVVAIIDPVQNPDGRDRYVQYQRSVTTLRSHPQNDDIEHANPWPGGRTNHYLFDLNRDFFLKTQVESHSRAVVYHEWMPHVFADHHEMGTNSTYFFAPPMDPYNEYVTPHLFKWWNIFAEQNAEAFDRFGWGYFTKESFDAFYPGMGDSYPSIKGSIGMCYEQASARGVSSTRDDGSILTLRETSWHHFTASMATLRTTADRRREQILDFYGYFVTALEEADQDPVKEIILLPGHDPQVTAKLIGNLLLENVEIERATAPFSNRRAHAYLSGYQGPKDFPEGTYIIRLNQPQKRLIKTLLAKNSPISAEFIEEERVRQENREDSHFYDITAWSMPLTYGVETYWNGEISRAAVERVTAQPLFTGSVSGGRAGQVYLIPYNTLASTKMLVRLLAENYRVRIARKEFTVEGRTWQPGTLIVRVNRNPESVHQRIAGFAAEYGIEVTAVHSGLSSQGIDIGSNNVVTILKPEVALVAEPPVSSYSYGALHYLFERGIDLPFTRITASDFVNLTGYNVVVLPSGNYGNALSEDHVNEFKSWIRRGGTVVAVSGAVNWLRNAGISQTNVLNGQEDPETGDEIQPWDTPGAIVKVNINPLSFMSYGVQPSVAALVNSSTIYQTFNDKFRDIGVYAAQDELRLSGWIWPDTENYLTGGGYLFVERYGAGKLVLFVEDPNFRASYDGLNKLFFNGIVLGPSLN